MAATMERALELYKRQSEHDAGAAENGLQISKEMPTSHTQYPYVTGSSVLGIKFCDGVLIAADMAASYGSTKRYKDVSRLKLVGEHTLIGGSGEISDFQQICQYLDELTLKDRMWDDGNTLGPQELHGYLNRVMYNRRNKFDPFWNSIVLGGVKDGKKYLGVVNMIGVHYEGNQIATGYGNYIAIPLLRSGWRPDLTLEEGVKLLEKCLCVLYYRDRSSINKFQIAMITEEKIVISDPFALSTNWELEAFKNPTVGAEGSW